MKQAGHNTVTNHALSGMVFPFYMRQWLPKELPGTTVQADRYLYNDVYAHFMREETGKSEDACNDSIKWVKLLVMFSIQHFYELRRNFKIPAGQESSWSDNGFSGAERRDTSITGPRRGLTPVAAVGPEALVEPAKGKMNVANLQTLLDRIFDDGTRMGIDSYSRETMNISFAIGFALHAMQDSYTARHAERQNSYAGSIARLYPWDNARDATLIGLFPEHPTVGAKCNGEKLLSHFQSDLLDYWTGAQYSRAVEASRKLIVMICKAGDTAANFGDLKDKYDKYWKKYETDYLHKDIEKPETPVRVYGTPASAEKLDPYNYKIAGGRPTF